MRELVSIFADAGCDDVRTYIQSGNVLFEATPALVARLPERVRTAIAERYGYEVPVILRTAGELAAVPGRNPFLDRSPDERGLCVAFLADKPTARRIAQLDPERSPPDEVTVHGREAYLYLPNGVARTRITNQYLDSTLGTVSTVRNWRTVRKLVELAAG